MKSLPFKRGGGPAVTVNVDSLYSVQEINEYDGQNNLHRNNLSSPFLQHVHVFDGESFQGPASSNASSFQ